MKNEATSADPANLPQTRGDKLRAHWVRWRIEQRKRKATEAREALETEGQLSLVLELGDGGGS